MDRKSGQDDGDKHSRNDREKGGHYGASLFLLISGKPFAKDEMHE